MKENIEHHIEEEEGEMFKIARGVFEKEELEELGSRMEARRTSAQRELGVPVRGVTSAGHCGSRVSRYGRTSLRSSS